MMSILVILVGLFLFLTVIALVVALVVGFVAPANVTRPWIWVSYLSIASLILVVIYLLMGQGC